MLRCGVRASKQNDLARLSSECLIPFYQDTDEVIGNLNCVFYCRNAPQSPHHYWMCQTVARNVLIAWRTRPA
jgi:hypothetical protein